MKRGTNLESVTPLTYLVGMLIDCDSCLMDGTDACSDCVVTVLLGEGPMDLHPVEEGALGALAEAGLVPRLRLIRDEEGEAPRAVNE